MDSLFAKIFLSFWLAAVLLGGSMFALEGYFRNDEVQQTQQQLGAHAETVATLLNDGGPAAVGAWLQGVQRGEHRRVWLVDAGGRPFVGPPLNERLLRRLGEGALHSGSWAIGPELFINVVAIPGQTPPLYLLAVSRIDRIHTVSPAVRLALAFTITGLVSFGLARLLTRRLRRLRAAAQALANGDLSVRVGYRGGDEVAALARDFDLMASRVRDLLENQRRLLSDVSHELRSPLARLKVALELARKKGDTDTALQRIERESDRLEELLAEVLSLARLESGQVRLRLEPLQLQELLEEIVQDADFEAQASGRSVQLTALPALVNADSMVLAAAVENVVRNAVRHTAEGSTVSVTLTEEGGDAVVSVRDRGPGIPEAELERVFEPFARVGEARDRASGGYGLGLAISRRAVAAHGGSVVARNAEGGGLEVVLRLPRAAA